MTIGREYLFFAGGDERGFVREAPWVYVDKVSTSTMTVHSLMGKNVENRRRGTDGCERSTNQASTEPLFSSETRLRIT